VALPDGAGPYLVVAGVLGAGGYLWYRTVGKGLGMLSGGIKSVARTSKKAVKAATGKVRIAGARAQKMGVRAAIIAAVGTRKITKAGQKKAANAARRVARAAGAPKRAGRKVKSSFKSAGKRVRGFWRR